MSESTDAVAFTPFDDLRALTLHESTKAATTEEGETSVEDIFTDAVEVMEYETPTVPVSTTMIREESTDVATSSVQEETADAVASPLTAGNTADAVTSLSTQQKGIVKDSWADEMSGFDS